MPDVVEQLAGVADEACRRAHRAVVSPAEQRRRGRGFLIVALSALVGYLALLFVVRSNRSVQADLAATLRMQRAEHPALARLMHAVSWFGFRPQSLLLPLSAITGTWLLRFRIESLFLVAAWGASFLSFITKLFVRRPRPENPIIRVIAADIRDTSFPSGHTLHYVAFWGFFMYLTFTKTRGRAVRWISAGLVTPLIALVGPSRIYLGHHWLTDVLASYLLGIAYLLGLVWLYQRVQRWTGGDSRGHHPR